jgi:penicillin amidase
LVLLVGLVLGGGYLWLRTSLPRINGSLAVTGLDKPVAITRDADGIPSIRAQTIHDAYFALGFVHAQDRLWQMEAFRRVGEGRLAEIVGKAGLSSDRFARVMGYERLAKASLATLSPGARAAVDAYTAGVNAWLRDHRGALPPEFVLLRFQPEPWQPEDCLIWGKLMATQLSGWALQLARLRLEGTMSAEDFDDLFPPYPADGPLTIDDALGQRADSESNSNRITAHLGVPIPAFPADPAQPAEASNAFAVAGAHTASGKPILANDPHLGFSAPNLWYLVRIDAPSMTLAGASVPGVPFLLIGHNGHVGWGFTTTGADTDALFAEKLEPDGASVVGPDGPEKLVIRTETIRVKGAEPETIVVRRSRHGPIVSDVVPIPGLSSNEIVALQSPTFRTDDRTADALFHMNHASNASAFLSALRKFDSPMQNIVFADINGMTGFVSAGRMPIRSAVAARPELLPGWTNSYDVKGYIPFERLPHAIDPARGEIVNANNRVVDDRYPYAFGGFWGGPDRAKRIEELLDERGGFDSSAFASIQTDNVSLGARMLLPHLLPLLAEASLDAAAKTAREQLASWDGAMDRSRPEPLIYHAWIDRLARSIAAESRLGNNPMVLAFLEHPRVLLRVLAAPERWCPHSRPNQVASPCEPLIAGAFATAIDELSRRFGNDPTRWRWGQAHRAVFAHRLFSNVPLLDRWSTIDVAVDGDDDTVNRGTVATGRGPKASWFYTPPLYRDIHGPGFREVLDLANLDNSLFMQATGQSGNPLSRHYGDLTKRWAAGQYVKLPPAPAVGTATPDTDSLVLLPETSPR